MKVSRLIPTLLFYAIGLLMALVLIYIDPSCKYPKPDTETPTATQENTLPGRCD